jgi:hypothetical protein
MPEPYTSETKNTWSWGSPKRCGSKERLPVIVK